MGCPQGTHHLGHTYTGTPHWYTGYTRPAPHRERGCRGSAPGVWQRSRCLAPTYTLLSSHCTPWLLTRSTSASAKQTREATPYSAKTMHVRHDNHSSPGECLTKLWILWFLAALWDWRQDEMKCKVKVNKLK